MNLLVQMPDAFPTDTTSASADTVLCVRVELQHEEIPTTHSP